MSQAKAIGVELHHPVAFWAGVALLIAGVLAHLPDFFASAALDYRMVDMRMSSVMHVGMIGILVGLGLSVYGLVPRLSEIVRPPRGPDLYVHAMDSARLTSTHYWLFTVLLAALVVDVMKPATLGFVMPGMRGEYGLTPMQLAAFPLTALTGTTLGSLVWGVLADRIGRRACVLLASLFFIGTSICGFMPSYRWNLFMCFFMGVSAGGLLPIVYALMAETVPPRMRSWLIIAHGGLGTIAGYLLASGLATVLEPVFTWRILWFMGLPTGLLIVALNRYVPESPRFLLQRGEEAAAQAVMRRFGAIAEKRPVTREGAVVALMAAAGARMPAMARLQVLFWRPLTSQSLMILLYGLSWGLVNWGFLTFLPTMLRENGFDPAGASSILFYASLAGIPGVLLAAWLYGRWSSRWTMAGFAALTCVMMMGFALLGPNLGASGRPVLLALTMGLMMSSTAVIAMLSPYAAEVYPTHLRGTGSGLAAGSGKLGGIVGPLVMGLVLSSGAAPSLAVLAMGIPIGLAALAVSIAGRETRARGLEHISEDLLARRAQPRIKEAKETR